MSYITGPVSTLPIPETFQAASAILHSGPPVQEVPIQTFRLGGIGVPRNPRSQSERSVIIPQPALSLLPSPRSGLTVSLAERLNQSRSLSQGASTFPVTPSTSVQGSPPAT